MKEYFKAFWWVYVVCAALLIFGLFGGFKEKKAEAQGGQLYISDVETAFDATGTGTFTVATGHSSPCMIIKNEDTTATNGATITQTLEGGGSGSFVLRGGESLTLGCTDRYPMFTRTLSWVPTAGTPDIRVIAWEL